MSKLPQEEKIDTQDLEEKKRLYEISFLLGAEEDAVQIKKILEDMGAKIVFENPIARISLAYTIASSDHAYFGYFHFALSPEHISSLDRAVSLKKVALRFIIISPPIAKYKERRPFDTRDTRIPVRYPSRAREPKKEDGALSNEDIEKKIEEILK